MTSKNGDVSDQNDYISPSEMCEILAISEQELVRLTRATIFVRKTIVRNKRLRAVYNWRDNFNRYIVHLRKPAEDAREEYQLEKKLTQAIVRQQKELELAVARGEMIKRSRVVSVMTSLIGQFKNHVLGVPARVTRRLIMQRDPHKVRLILDGEMRNCLLELNQFSAGSFDEQGKMTSNFNGNEAIKRVKARVAKRRRRTS